MCVSVIQGFGCGSLDQDADTRTHTHTHTHSLCRWLVTNVLCTVPHFSYRVLACVVCFCAIQGFGCGSLDQDAEELISLCRWLVTHNHASRLVLMGQSTGCNDLVRFMQKAVAQGLLLSPTDKQTTTADSTAAESSASGVAEAGAQQVDTAVTLPVAGVVLQAPVSDSEVCVCVCMGALAPVSLSVYMVGPMCSMHGGTCLCVRVCASMESQQMCANVCVCVCPVCVCVCLYPCLGELVCMYRREQHALCMCACALAHVCDSEVRVCLGEWISARAPACLRIVLPVCL